MRPVEPNNDQPGGHSFATTRWSVVLSAGGQDSSVSHGALASLCETYWYPLYAFVRRRGFDVEEAQDLTQAFFAYFIEREAIRVADPERGRFRSFLLGSLQNFLANQWRDGHAAKRGGTKPILSLDWQSGEDRYRLEPVDMATPEKIFERRWALTLLQTALTRLEAELKSSGKAELFELLKDRITGERQDVPYAARAEQLQMTEGAIKVIVHRMRRRCRELLREEIRHTVGDAADIDAELRDLFSALG